MSSLITKPIRLVGTEQRNWLGLSFLAIFSLSGCIGQLPDGTENTEAVAGKPGDASSDAEFALASEIREESRFQVVNNIVSSAEWDGSAGVLQLRGVREIENQPLIITNATTREVLQLISPSDIRQFRVSDDDDNRGRVIPINLASAGFGGSGFNPAGVTSPGVFNVPCTIRVQTNFGVQIVPVANAPQACVGLQNAALGILQVTTSEWESNRQRLVVRGNGALPQQIVSVMDAATGQLIGTDQANSLGVWSVNARNLFTIPCAINVTSNGQYAQAPVVGAPQQCATILGTIPGGLPGALPPGTLPQPFFPPANNQLPVGAVPGTNFNNLPLFNQAPESIIQTPAADMVVPPGTVLSFTGIGFDPDGNVPLTYEWRSDGAFPINSGQNASMVFQQPGIYRVTLTVRDSLGMMDPTPATRLVIVQSPSQAPGNIGVLQNQAPSGVVISPQQTNTAIAAGQSVYFAASGTDPEGDRIMYYWNFGGGTQSIALQNPGNIIFAYPGTYVVSMTAADSLGNVDRTPDYRTITVSGSTPFINPPFQVSNQAPTGQILSPASDMVVPAGSPVTFSGTGYDADNNVPLRFYWNFGNAAPASTQQTATVTFNQPGVYYVSLSVTDALGLADPMPKTRIINVTGTGTGVPCTTLPCTGNNIPTFNNQPPEGTIVSPASDMQVMVGQTVRFESIGMDPENNSPLVYFWDFDGAIPNMLVQNPGDISFSQPGSYRVTLLVQDSQGLADRIPAVRNITVTSPTGTVGQAPNGIILSPQVDTQISVGQSVNFSAVGQDNDGQVVSYRWDFGGAAANSTLQTPPAVVFAQAGTYRVTLTVRDNTGLQDPTPDVRTVTVIGTGTLNQAPDSGIVSPATDLVINRGDSLNFLGVGIDTASLGGASSMTYSWDFGGAAFGTVNTATASPGIVQFNTAGTFTVTLTVRNLQGLPDPTPAKRIITVLDTFGTNRAPTATITSPQVIGSVALGQTLNFSATAVDPEGDVVSYYWDFDGGAGDSTQQNPGFVVFNRPGTYNVRLYVTDARGNRNPVPASVMVTVTGVGNVSASAPTATILSPAVDQVINIGETLSFNGMATDLDNNTPLLYRWSFDGLIPGSSAQIPGNVTFNRVGTYKVIFTARDSTGAVGLPVIRTITVRSPSGSLPCTTFPCTQFPGTGTGTGGPVVGLAPDATIVSPSADMTVAVGQQIAFSGTGTDPDSASPVTYEWNFGGGGVSATGNNVQNPVVTFSTPGTFTVMLTVRDIQGNVDPSPAFRRITVGTGTGFPTTGGTATSASPNGIIRTPSTDIVVRANTPVQFSGEGVDPLNPAGTGMTFSWSFGAATPSVGTGANPGSVTFTTPGVYTVRMTVTNSSGVPDPIPAVRVITVTP